MPTRLSRDDDIVCRPALGLYREGHEACEACDRRARRICMIIQDAGKKALDEDAINRMPKGDE